MSLLASLLHRPVRLLMLYALVCSVGLLSYFFLPVELLPNVSFRHITIYLPVRGGMPPDQVEKLVTRPVEDVMALAPEILAGKVRGRIVLEVA